MRTKWEPMLGALVCIVLVGGVASGKTRTEQGSERVSSGGHVEFSIPCKSGFRLTGVGFAAEISTVPPRRSQIGASRLEPETRSSLAVRGSEALGLDKGGSFEAYAYCKRDLRSKVAGSSGSVPGGEVATLEARCSGKRNAIGGGFSAPPAGAGPGEIDGRLLASRRSGKRSWSVSYANLDTDPAAVTTFAICARLGVRQVAGRGVATDFDNRSADAKCSKRRKLISGGFDALVDDGPVSTDFALITRASAQTARKWTTLAANYEPQLGARAPFKSLGYCARRP